MRPNFEMVTGDCLCLLEGFRSVIQLIRVLLLVGCVGIVNMRALCTRPSAVSVVVVSTLVGVDPTPVPTVLEGRF